MDSALLAPFLQQEVTCLQRELITIKNLERNGETRKIKKTKKANLSLLFLCFLFRWLLCWLFLGSFLFLSHFLNSPHHVKNKSVSIFISNIYKCFYKWWNWWRINVFFNYWMSQFLDGNQHHELFFECLIIIFRNKATEDVSFHERTAMHCFMHETCTLFDEGKM